MCLIHNRFKSVSTWCLKGTLCESNHEAGLTGGNEAQTPVNYRFYRNYRAYVSPDSSSHKSLREYEASMSGIDPLTGL